MARYKVIVPLLNVRNKPVANFETKIKLPTVSEGVILELEEETNVPNPALGKWYKDSHNQFYWGGGLQAVSETPYKAELSKKYPDWMTDLKLPEIWQKVTGKNIGIAIIDSGIINNNNDLLYDKTNFYLSTSVSTLEDTFGHGTHCAGTIGAKNKGKFSIGVAPDSQLYICKISNNGVLNSQLGLLEYANAIDWCTKQDGIKIISISWSNFCSDTEVLTKVQKSVDDAVKKGKIILASRGNIHEPDDDSKKYPACFKNVISVGIIPSGNWYNYTGSKDILVPGVAIESYDFTTPDLLSTKSGTSMSTAIMAGITALILEKKGNQITYKDMKSIVSDISVPTIIYNETVNCIDGNKLLNLINS